MNSSQVKSALSTLSYHELRLLKDRKVAHLATADGAGRPHVIPVCYACDGIYIYSVLDQKPKSAPPSRLKRVRNIQANPHVSLVLDHYDEDWQCLWYILVSGTAEVIFEGPGRQSVVGLLRGKYEQYRRMDIDGSPFIRITPDKVTTWGRLPSA